MPVDNRQRYGQSKSSIHRDNASREIDPLKEIPIISLSEFTFDYGRYLYHGTTLKSARDIVEGREPPTLLAQAQSLCEIYGLRAGLDNLLTGASSPFSWMLSPRRDSSMSTSDTLALALSYASRGPEWQWFLLQYLYNPQAWESGENSEEHLISARRWVLEQVEIEPKAVLVMEAPAHEFEWTTDEYRLYQEMGFKGNEVVLTMPLSAGITPKYLIPLTEMT